jgi:dipeptidyl aminopeptidase/acylaminoacyl peptidase
MRSTQAPRLLVLSLLLTGGMPVAAAQSVEMPIAPTAPTAASIPGAWSTDGRLVGYLSTRRNGPDADLYISNPRDPKADPLIGECKGVGEFSPDRSRAVVIERVSAAGVEVDPSTRTVRRWATRETGGLDPGADVEPRPLEMTGFDGLAIAGFLYRPDPARFGDRRAPIVYIHGGPDGPSHPGRPGRNTCLLNELGIAILYPSERDSTPGAQGGHHVAPRRR